MGQIGPIKRHRDTAAWQHGSMAAWQHGSIDQAGRSTQGRLGREECCIVLGSPRLPEAPRGASAGGAGGVYHHEWNDVERPSLTLIRAEQQLIKPPQ
jgi:hypothetical protein